MITDFGNIIPMHSVCDRTANTSIVKINHILSLLGYEIDIKPSNPFITE